jgi:TM2 domain-containing membrane protein YozV
MRKSLLFFLGCVFGTIISAHGKTIHNSRDTMVFHAVKNPHALAVGEAFVFTDTLNGQKTVYHKKHRLFAALLAFPLGIFGLHRMYMHTSPLVPLVYIATFGGVFGILPFIDFVLILLNKDIHLNYTSNPHLFMWEKRERNDK